MIKINDINIAYQYKVLITDSELEIKKEKITLIYGKSGCGKTSLLYLIGLFNQNSCQYYIDDLLVNDFNDDDLSKLKRNYIGYVFQDSVLFDYLNVKDNLKLYSALSNHEISEKKKEELLQTVNLDKHILNQEINTLSGGEKQRLAIACALSKEPELLILDEPTSALDHKNEESLYVLLQKIVKERKIAVVIVSHSLKAHEYSDVIYEIKNQKIKLVQDSDEATIKDNLEINKYKLIKNDFYQKYLRFYHQKNIQRTIISLISLMLMILGGFTCLIFLNDRGNNQKEEVFKLSENQILLMNENKAVDQKLDLDIKALYQEYGIKQIYPYSAIKIFINGNGYDVVPYYHENKLEAKVSQYLDKSKTVFISNTLLNNEINYLNLNKHIQTNGFIIKGNKQIENIEFEFEVAGYLKSGVASEYLNGDDPGYVLMPYDLLQEYYDLDNCCGYTVFFDSCNQMINALDQVKVENVFITSNFQNLDVINASLEKIDLQQKLIEIVLILILGIQFIFVQYWLYHYRNYEFVILNINGLAKKDIYKIVMIEYLIKILLVLIISLFTMILSLLLKLMILKLYLISLASSFIFIIIIMIIVIKRIKHLDPIKIIRN